jgi:hypothetical protein
VIPSPWNRAINRILPVKELVVSVIHTSKQTFRMKGDDFGER